MEERQKRQHSELELMEERQNRAHSELELEEERQKQQHTQLELVEVEHNLKMASQKLQVHVHVYKLLIN